MSSIDEKTKKLERVRALEQSNQDRIAKQKEKERKLKDRYKFIIGEIMFEKFPDILNFDVQTTTQDFDNTINEFKETINRVSDYIKILNSNISNNDVLRPLTIDKRT